MIELNASHYWLTQAHIPLALLDATGPRSPRPDLAAFPIAEDLVAVDIEICDGHISQIVPTGTMAIAPELPVMNRRGGLVWPTFVDIHTHLDKGHMWYRVPNPDGTFQAALQACLTDQVENWQPDDLYRRMTFGLKCSYAHGTQALRTHLDAWGEQGRQSLEIFQTLREEWRDRLALQAVCLVSLDYFMTPAGEQLADWVAAAGAILGGVALPHPDLDAQIERVFQLAADRGLTELDFHVDESLAPTEMSLWRVAEIAQKYQQSGAFTGQIVCGHCCSLSVQSPEVAERTMQAVKAANIGVISLPLCNLYLQDRQPRQTPRYRGVTLLHELQQHGIPVAIASDNCRDPFHAYGDHDGLEVFKLSARIAHLDHPWGDWMRANTWTAGELMGLEVGRIGVGRSADLILFKARNLNELMARSQHDRLVLRQGQPIATELPDYAELDDLIPVELS